MDGGIALRLTETAVEVVIAIGTVTGIGPDQVTVNRSIPPRSGIVRRMVESTAGNGHIHLGENKPRAAEVTTDLDSAVTTMITAARLHARPRRGNLRRLRPRRATAEESTTGAAAEALAAGVEADTTIGAIRLRLHRRSRKGAGAAIGTMMIGTAVGMTLGSPRAIGVLRGRSGGASRVAGGVVISSRRSPGNAMTIMEAVIEILETDTNDAKSLTTVVHVDATPLRWEEVPRRGVVVIQVWNIQISAAVVTLVVAEVAVAAAIAIASTVRQSVVGSVVAEAVVVHMNAVVAEDAAAAGGFPTQREVASTRIVI